MEQHALRGAARQRGRLTGRWCWGETCSAASAARTDTSTRPRRDRAMLSKAVRPAVCRVFLRSILATLESAPLSSGWLHVVLGSVDTAPWSGCTPAMLSAMRDDTSLCGGATGSSAPSAVSSASAVPPPTPVPAGSSPPPSRGPVTRMHAASSRPQPQQPAARQCAASVVAGPRMRQQERACAAARHVRPSAAVTSAVAAGASSPQLLAPSPRVSAVTVYPCTSARLQQQPTAAIDPRERVDSTQGPPTSSWGGPRAHNTHRRVKRVRGENLLLLPVQLPQHGENATGITKHGIHSTLAPLHLMTFHFFSRLDEYLGVSHGPAHA